MREGPSGNVTRVRRGVLAVCGAVAVATGLTFSSLSGAATNADPVKIGGVFWTQGPAKNLGDVSFNGANLAIKEINDAGGILGGRKVELLKYDEGYNADTVVTSGKKAQSDGVVAIVGGNDATTCAALAQYAKQVNVPIAITACGSDKTIKLGYKGLVHVREPVLSSQSKANALRAIARWMVKTKKYKNVQGVGVDSQFVKNTDAEFKKYFKANAPSGFKYNGMIYFPYGTSQARIEVTKGVGSKPDMLYLGLWGKDVIVNAVKAARQAGYKGDIMINEVVLLPPEAAALGKDGEGVYDTTGWWHDPKVPANEAFYQAYKKQFKSDPEWFGETAYTATKLMLKAIDKAGSTDSAAIAGALHNTPIVTPSGETLKFSDNGMRSAKKWYLIQIVKGKLVLRGSIPMA
jgi:branched-chain amino acid transport system substrate-binding protein